MQCHITLPSKSVARIGRQHSRSACTAADEILPWILNMEDGRYSLWLLRTSLFFGSSGSQTMGVLSNI